MGDILGPSIAEAEKYENAKIGFNAAFMDYLERPEDKPGRSIMPAAMVTQSTGPSEEYIFIGDLPGFEEWKDDRKMGSLAAHKITVANKNWANGVPIHRNEIMDDRLGIVNKRLGGLANKARRHRDTLLMQLLLNGFTGTTFKQTGDGTCYTGELFFSNSHTLEGSSATIDNLATDALTETSLEARIEQMTSFTTWDGTDPLDITPSHLIVGPKLEWVAKRLVGSQIVVRTGGDGGETNIHYGTLDVIVNQRLIGTYDDYWFLAALNESMQPLIFQEREAITTAAQVDWNSDDVFNRGLMKFGAQARYGVGYFDPRLIIGSQV
jgi:phage major head subunit gpT-like protein